MANDMLLKMMQKRKGENVKEEEPQQENAEVQDDDDSEEDGNPMEQKPAGQAMEMPTPSLPKVMMQAGEEMLTTPKEIVDYVDRVLRPAVYGNK